jgi:hypothetical protein
MKCWLIIVVCLCWAAPCAHALSESDSEARAVATNWLALLDNGRYTEAFNKQAARIKRGGKLEDFERWCKSRRTPLGRPLSRSFFQVKSLHQLIGAPDGNYQRILFKTRFERKSQSVEQVIVTAETGHWQVSGYRMW